MARLSSPTKQECAAPQRFLLIRPGGIGDAVLLAPSIRSIKNTYPDSSVTILAESRNSEAFTLIPFVDTVLCYDRPGDLLQALLNRYDVVIDSEQWYRLSAVVARLVRSPVKIGFDTNERRRMFTHAIGYDQNSYEVDNFLALLKPLGVTYQRDGGAVPSLELPSQVESRALQLLQTLDHESFIAMFPGASKVEKRWGADRFRRLAEMLAVSRVKVVVIGGKEERSEGEMISDGGLGLNLAGLTSLSETAAVIKKSALLVSGDSGVLHIAAVLGVPTVSIFGPGRIEKWAPQGIHHIVITKGLSCSPCTLFGNTPTCPNKTRCMFDITVDEVVNAVNMLLSSQQASLGKNK